MLSTGIDGSEFSRKKKHPDVAYRSHEFFDMTARGAMEVGQESVRVPRVGKTCVENSLCRDIFFPDISLGLLRMTTKS